MPRSVKEWVGKNDDAMPTQKVFLRLYDAQNGICACGCRKMNLNLDKIVRDHRIPLKDGGENRESNLQLMLEECHLPKTAAENTARAKGDRHRAKAFVELRDRKSKWPSRPLGTGNNQRTATREFRKRVGEFGEVE